MKSGNLGYNLCLFLERQNTGIGKRSDFHISYGNLVLCVSLLWMILVPAILNVRITSHSWHLNVFWANLMCELTDGRLCDLTAIFLTIYTHTFGHSLPRSGWDVHHSTLAA